MTDGPHKSLPMASCYKKVMERATKAAYSPVEVREAQRVAIASEFKKDLVGEVRSILKSETDSVLLIDNVSLIAKLEGVRARHRASPVVDILVDELVGCAKDGRLSEYSLHDAIEQAADGCMASTNRQIEEHYLREVGTKGVTEVRQRLDLVRDEVAIKSIAADVLDANLPSRATKVSKRTGLDEGVSLVGASS